MTGNCTIVTGGAGFIGANFVRMALCSTEARVVVMDKLTYAGNLSNLSDVWDHPRLVFERVDISDGKVVAGLYRKHRPTAIVNFAAETHVDRSIDSPADFIQTNIVGAYTLIECARHYLSGEGAPSLDGFRFLHVSTDEVYGTLGDSGTFREDTPYAPNSPYAASKASADHVMRAYQETFGVPTLITNCSNNYGPYQFPEKLIPLMILNAVEGRPLPIYGDGGNVRDWLHVEDHCRAIFRVLEAGCPGRKYNIGSRSERTNLQVVDTVCAILEDLVPPDEKAAALESTGAQRFTDLRTFVQDRPGHDQRYAIDPTRLETELGWRPEFDFESGLEATVQWYLNHREWCADVQKGNYRRERLGIG